MIERFIITLAIMSIGIGTTYFLRKRNLEHATARIRYRDPLLEQLSTDRPTILYFTADYCAACRFQQSPALEELASTLGESLQIIEIDVEKQASDAERWGIMSLPTTYILNSKGQATAVNYGFASAHQLMQQLEG